MTAATTLPSLDWPPASGGPTCDHPSCADSDGHIDGCLNADLEDMPEETVR